MLIQDVSSFRVDNYITLKNLRNKIEKEFASTDTDSGFRSIFVGTSILEKLKNQLSPIFPIDLNDDSEALIGLWENISVFKKPSLGHYDVVVFYSGNHGFEGSKTESLKK